MNHHADWVAALDGPRWLALVLSATALLLYLAGANRLWRRGIDWPLPRLLRWTAGCTAVAVPLVGSFPHLLGHLLVGMLAPLLLVSAAPATLLLRALPVHRARRVAALLSSRAAGVLTNPVVAGLLNVGGLWVLYRTGTPDALHAEPWLNLLVHGHLLAAGYLFTFAITGGPDPAPHRWRPGARAAVLVLAIAAHNVLAKSLYPEDPVASQWMYYGGAPVEVTLVILVCRAWLGRGWVRPGHDRNHPDCRKPRRHRRVPAAPAPGDQGAVRGAGDRRR